jgi:hypothetical protein
MRFLTTRRSASKAKQWWRSVRVGLHDREEANLQKAIWIAVILITAMATSAKAVAANLPRCPLEPTPEDCAELARTYSAAGADASSKVFHCLLTDPPNVGRGEEAWPPDCQPRTVYRAYPECFGDELERCQVGQQGLIEVKLCQDRLGEREAQSDNNIGSTLHTLTDWTDSIQEAADLFNKGEQLLTNPTKFLYDALQQYSHDLAMRMFDPDGQLNSEYSGVGDDIYKLARNSAHGGMELTMSGLPREIASASMEAIDKRFQFALSQMSLAMVNMNSISVSSEAANTPAFLRAPTLSTSNAATEPSADPNCAIIRDPDRSRQLENQDEQTWLNLVGRCTK